MSTDNLSCPKTVDWFVTSICNLKCGFCYGPEPEWKEDFSKAFKIVEKIIESQTRNVTLCGGDPMVHPGIYDIISMLRMGGKKVYSYIPQVQ